jgi:predicted DNA-binding transcriptional regulator YafY
VEAVTAMTEQAGSPSPLPPVDPATLSTTALTCRDRERLRFGYTAADGVRTDRLVEPHRLVSLGRRWYLVAYDLTRHDWRTFRLDRVAGSTPTGVHFAPRRLPAADAATMVKAAFDRWATRVTVTAQVQAPGPDVVARLGRWARVEALDERTSLLRMEVDSLDWAAHALGSVGAQFTVREPPELLELLRDWSRRFDAAAHPTR